MTRAKVRVDLAATAIGWGVAVPSLPPAVTLDEAWKEAEAALPPGCTFQGIRRSALGMKDLWGAAYSDEGGWFNFYGDTPTAALQALTAALRGSTESSGA